MPLVFSLCLWGKICGDLQAKEEGEGSWSARGNLYRQRRLGTDENWHPPPNTHHERRAFGGHSSSRVGSRIGSGRVWMQVYFSVTLTFTSVIIRTTDSELEWLPAHE